MDDWMGHWIGAFPRVYDAMLRTELGIGPGSNPIHRESSLLVHSMLAAKIPPQWKTGAAAFLHDVGKICTGSDRDERRYFTGHEAVGALLVFAMEESHPGIIPGGNHVAFLVRYHTDPRGCVLSNVLKRNLYQVCRADIWGRISNRQVCDRRQRRLDRTFDSIATPLVPSVEEAVLTLGPSYVPVPTDRVWRRIIVQIPDVVLSWLNEVPTDVPAWAKQFELPAACSYHVNWYRYSSSASTSQSSPSELPESL